VLLEWATLSTGNHAKATHRRRYYGIVSRCCFCHKSCCINWNTSNTAYHVCTRASYMHATIYQVWFCTLAPRGVHKPSSWPNLVFGISSWDAVVSQPHIQLSICNNNQFGSITFKKMALAFPMFTEVYVILGRCAMTQAIGFHK